MSRPAADRVTSISGRVGIAVLAAVAYLPALCSSPGRMPADTKLYLYLDPGGLLSRAGSTFEPDQFAGWVPHQQIAYLWPSGPWYWLFDALGVPDWIAHRLWIGTVLFLAGLGVRRVARLLGLAEPAPTIAGLVYQLSPFVLAYVSRTSLLLLPWAGLGWIVALTIRAAARAGSGPDRDGWRRRLVTWREPALIAVIVATVGAINATALALVIPAPLLWLVHAAWQRTLTWRQALGIAARVGVTSLAASLWWMAMLVVQARHGADVLAFSETLEDVSRNSTGSEVLRGLGYWLFYQRNPVGPTTTASFPYLVSSAMIALSFLTILGALVAFVVVRWPHRRYAALLVAVGAVLAVGVHPLSSPSPLMAFLVDDDESGLALALRSSTRAMPVALLGASLALAAGVAALSPVRTTARSRVRLPVGPRWVAAGLVAVVVVAAMPAVRGAALVDPQIDRDQDPPAAWQAAAVAVDAHRTDGRVLQLPGAEFGAFRWGYTADQPLVGLADTPLVTRDLLPLGSPAAMDLLFALDDRFQTGVAEPTSVAPVARYLGAESLLLTNDLAFDRYDTARPELVDALLTDPLAPGLEAVERIGEPIVNVPDLPMIDATSLLDTRIGAPISPLTVLGVEDAAGVHRASGRTVVLAGSGDGVVDAAAAGLLDGDVTVRYSASLHDDAAGPMLEDALALVLTDSNRDRAHHWRGSQDVTGHTEPGGPDPDVLDHTNADQRLALFDLPDGVAEATTQTVAVQDGPVTAIASSYGEPFAYRPEDRAVMAVDGDPATAWSVADHGDPVGERLRLDLVAPLPAGRAVTLRQIAPRPGGRTITGVRITADGTRAFDVTLDASSWTDGYALRDPALDGARTIEIEITAVDPGDPSTVASRDGVGFAEIDLGEGPTTEWIRLPLDAGSSDAATALPLAVVLTRLRTSPTDAWRSDPEPDLRRLVTVPGDRRVELEATLRLDARSTDAAVADLLAPAFSGGRPALADRRLTGSLVAFGWAALDGDPASSWVTPFDDALGATLSVPVEDTFDGRLTVGQPTGSFSPITRLAVLDAVGTEIAEVDVPPPDAAGGSEISVPVPADGELRLAIVAVDARSTVDRRFGDVVALPAAISELRGAGLRPVSVDLDAALEVDCDDSWLAIDEAPVAVRWATTVGALLAGDPVTAVPCAAVDLDGGEHRIAGLAAAGLTVDRIVLDDGARAALADGGEPIAVTVTGERDRDRALVVDPCPAGCWVILGEGFNAAWSASAAPSGDAGSTARDLGAPALVDGGFNGWWLQPTTEPTEVHIRWTAQAPVTWGLVVLVATAIALVAVVALTQPVRMVSALDDRRTRAPQLAWPPRSNAGEGRRMLGTGIALVGVSAVVIGPWWALPAALVGVLTWLTANRGRPLRVPELVGVGAAAVTAAAVVWIERRDLPYPNAGWTESFDHLNGLALFALVCAGVGAVCDTDRADIADRADTP